MPSGTDTPVATKVAAGGPKADVEITPEMERAGIDALQTFNLSEDRLDWIVCEIYLAVSMASRSEAPHA